MSRDADTFLWPAVPRISVTRVKFLTDPADSGSSAGSAVGAKVERSPKIPDRIATAGIRRYNTRHDTF